MAYLSFLFFLFCSLHFVSLSEAHTRPKSLVLPVYKDASTLQYLTYINQRTPLVPVGLTLHLGGPSLWVNCEEGYDSSTIRPGGCNNSLCRRARAALDCEPCLLAAKGPGCTNSSTCWSFPLNTISGYGIGGELATDIISVNSTDGKSSGHVFTVPHFPFYCGHTTMVESLASGVTGMAGLGRTQISLPYQFHRDLRLKRRFTMCLSSSTTSNGVVHFGKGSYILLPNVNVANSLMYTPLILNKKNIELHVINKPSPEYFIGVKSIKINGKTVKINSTLLSIDKDGFSGTKISTVNPYTVLQGSIYKAVVEAFTTELRNVTRVPPVAPFGACYSSKSIGSTRVGPAVPPIDLVLQNESVVWRMFGANSMVQVSDDVMCLGFVDGGLGIWISSIVIGGHQIEDNLLHFDLEKSRLGFSSSLLFHQTTCTNFKDTSHTIA